MKRFLFLILLAPMLLSFAVHKYYLSVMDLEYNEESKSIQMITRIFFDDLEDVLNERYAADIIVDAKAEQTKLDAYLEKYIQSKIKIEVNGLEQLIQYVGKEYEDDYVVCYLEVIDVDTVKSFEITNELLMDLFPEQKNMTHTAINGKKKSFILTSGNAKALLNFSQ